MYVSKDSLNHFLVYFSAKNNLKVLKTWYFPYSAFRSTGLCGGGYSPRGFARACFADLKIKIKLSLYSNHFLQILGFALILINENSIFDSNEQATGIEGANA